MAWLKFKNKQPPRQPHLMEGQSAYMFRRSRTLTGSTSNVVQASAGNRGQLKTDRLKLHELKAHRRKILQMLGAVLAGVGVFALLVANFIVTPDIAASSPGVNEPNVAAYQESVYGYFAGRPLERFGFLLNPARLEAHLQYIHPELAGVGVARDWYGGNVRIGLVFSRPLLAWKTGGQRFYVDDRGKAFGYNHFKEPAVSVTDETGLPPNQSGVVASTRFIRFLGRMVGAVNGYGMGKVEQVVLPPSTREISLKLSGRDYVIRTNSDRDPLKQAEDIANALRYFDKQGIAPRYIDVRVAHKAFYQ